MNSATLGYRYEFNGKKLGKEVTFIANSDTAAVSIVTLVGTEVSKVANSTNSFTYTVTVKDRNGNLVPSATVAVASDKIGVVTSISGVTNAAGQATLTLTSTKKAVVDITVSAKVGTVMLNDDTQSKVANGTSSFTYTAQVVDINGNPVTEADLTVNWAQNKGTDVNLSATASTTNANGQATITLISTKKAVADITVTAKVGTTESINADNTVSFTYDITTAKVGTVMLNDDTQSKVANGTSSFTYTAQVVDINSNPVTGITVNWTQNKGNAVTLPTSSETDANGQATITLTSTTLAVADITVNAQVGTTSSATGKTVSFIAGPIDTDTSTLSISTDRIVANNKETNTADIDYATLTLNIMDAHRNGISGLEDKIQFVVMKNDGNEVSSGVSVDNISASPDVEGKYVARIYGNVTGIYNIRAKVNNDYSINSNRSLNLYSFTFEMTPSKATIVLNGTYMFNILAKPSDYPNDTTKYENLSSGISWSSSDSSVASIETNGLIKGKSVGITNITSSGNYKGFNFSNLQSILGVQGQISSDKYGNSQPTDRSGTLIIEPPNYSLLLNCGSIVDGIGSNESNFFGGKGGGRVVISKLNLVSSVQISTGEFRGSSNTTERNIRQLTKLVFNMNDGSSAQCATSGNSANITTSTYTVPNNQVLEGVTVDGGTYLHTINFITKLKDL